MAEKRVTVVALIRAKKGMEERVKQELISLIGPTRSEKGCLNYDLHQAADENARFMFFENWTSKADLGAHLEMPYLKVFMKKAEELLAEPAQITVWERIA